MFKRATVFMLLFAAIDVAAQGQAPQQSTNRRGYFGAPVLKYTTLRNQSAVIFGGRGAWNVTPSLMLGGGLYGTLSQIDAPGGVVSPTAEPLDVKFESFGLELEYAPAPAAPTHLTFGAFLGGAADRYVKDGTDSQEGETDFMFLLEPAVGLDQRITQWAHLSVAVSYRLVSGVNQQGLTEGDFNAAAAVIALKLGRF